MAKRINFVILSKDDNTVSLRETLDSLVKSGCNLNSCLVALNSTEDLVSQYCKEKGIKTYLYEDVVEVYSKAYKNLDCTFISFLNSGDILSATFLTKILVRMGNSTTGVYVTKLASKDDVRYSLNGNVKNDVYIDREPHKVWINLNSCYISKDILDKITLNSIKYFTDNLLISKAIMLNGGYIPCKGISVYTDKLFENLPEAKQESYDIEWYTNVYKFSKEVLDYSMELHGCHVRYAQYLVSYVIKYVINENVNSKNKHILKGDSLKDFYSNMSDILSSVEDEVILKTQGNKRINYVMLRIRDGVFNEKPEYRVYSDKAYVTHNNRVVFDASDTKAKIFLMDCKDSQLSILGSYPLPFDESRLKIFTVYEGEKIYAEKNPLYSGYRVYGEEVYDNYNFELRINLKRGTGKSLIRLYLEVDGTAVIPLYYNFSKPLSRLSGLKNAYWDCDGFTFNYKKNSIQVMDTSLSRKAKRELKYLFSLAKSSNSYSREAFRLRLMYWLSKPLFRKDIWLFSDKIYKGGDNGEYLYTYASNQNDGIKKYYILKEGCLDTERFKREGKKYVTYGSLKHKLLFLNSNFVFETHNNGIRHHSFDVDNEKYFRDLFNSNHVCIQHGLTVQYLPDQCNRVNDNLQGYFIASPFEKSNLLQEEFAFKGYESYIHETGVPRYDGLINNDKKQILITPTWRNYLAMPAVFSESRPKNNDFKETHYFKLYNSLINNEKLIRVAKETGYKLVYLLHPVTSSQISDYEDNGEVELIAATDELNYEKILTESSLMLTDYSGVQFDFAYMYKPVVYFHPDELPPSYNEGTYKYNEHALGDITKTVEDTVDVICEYMLNDCKIKDEYKERVDNFFYHHDFNNCERIYNKIMSLRG